MKQEKKFGVVSITKAGVPARGMVPHSLRFVTKEEADKQVAQCEELNPGKKFVVVSL